MSYRGKVERRSTGQTDKKKAKVVLDARVKALDAAEAGLIRLPSRAAEQVTIGQRLDALVAHFEIEGARSLPQMKSHLIPVRTFFGTVRVMELTAELVDAYILQRQEAEAAPASINRGLQLLAQAVRPFLEEQRQPVPALRRLPERNVRQGFFEQGDVEAMIAALPDPLADMTRYAYWSGWRRSEITGLTWAEVDLAARVIRLDPLRSKNGDGRLLVIEGPLADLMARRWQDRIYDGAGGVESVSPLVFHRDGEPIVDFRKAWASACITAGLYQVVTGEDGQKEKVPTRLFHDLRRSAVRNMVNRGVPERVAMTVSGHRTRAVFDRYHIVTEQDQRAGVQRAWATLEATPKPGRLKRDRAEGGRALNSTHRNPHSGDRKQKHEAPKIAVILGACVWLRGPATTCRRTIDSPLARTSARNSEGSLRSLTRPPQGNLILQVRFPRIVGIHLHFACAQRSYDPNARSAGIGSPSRRLASAIMQQA